MKRFCRSAFLWLGSLAICCGWSIAVAGTGQSATPLQEAESAFHRGHFEKVLNLVQPLITEEPGARAGWRLKILSLVRLGKTGEGVDAYEQYSKVSGKTDDSLLRELAIHTILPVRTDMREQMRGAAYTALKEISSPDVIPFMEEGLADGSGMIRVLVAEGLSQHHAALDSPGLQSALEDPAGLVRATVLKGFGRSGGKSHIPLIIPLTQDKQEVVQVAAAGALFMLGETKYWKRVKDGTTVREGYERGAALRTLGELGDPRALDILQQGILDRQPSIRAAAVAALGRLGMPMAVPILIPMLADPVPAVRSVVSVTLGGLRSEEAIRPLTRTLHDRNDGVRVAAIAGLLKLNTPFQVVSGTVQQLIGHTNPGLRSSVAKALGNGRASDVVPLLSLLLHDPIPKPRITAARSLGRVGGREVMYLLTRTLRDTDAAVKVTAAGSLARILTERKPQ